MTTVEQRSLAAGEVTPGIFARTDQVKHATGLRTCRNYQVDRQGGVSNRPGTEFIAQVKDSSKISHKAIPFIFNPTQTYLLEFGDIYMRVIKDGVQLTDTSETITGATQANPVVLTIVGHSLSTGQEIQVSGVVGMVELNNQNFKVTNLTANTVSLQEMDGTTNLDGTAFTAYTSGGTADRVFEIVTPYPTADLSTLSYAQDADVITIVHPNHDPRELSRLGDTSWTLTAITFEPDIARPAALASSGGTGTGRTLRYAVVAIKDDLEESLVGLETAAAEVITAATQASPVVITAVGHPYVNGDRVLITGIVGMTEINDREFTIGGVAGNDFSLLGEDGTSHTAYVSGGTSRRVHSSQLVTNITSTNPVVVTWTAVAGAIEYDIYKEENGIYGAIGKSGVTSFSDDGIEPNLNDTPAPPRNPFAGTGNRPSAVTSIQGRVAYGGSNNRPETVFMSRTGYPHNFTFSNPLQDDDSITFRVRGGQVNQIRHMGEQGQLVIFTGGGEWVVTGAGEGGRFSATDLPTAKLQSFNGAALIRPIITDKVSMYVQREGSILRSFEQIPATGGFDGDDITIFSDHLVEGFTILDMAYERVPSSVIWLVRSDGKMLAVTFLSTQQLLGWSTADFGTDLAENVAVVPEGTESVLYVIVKRTINSKTVRYIERLATRSIGDVRDMIFMDSTLTFDGRNTTGSHTMAITGGPTWLATDILTLTSSVAFFSAGDVGNEIQLTGADGSVVNFQIDTFTSNVVVTGRPDRTVPVSLQGIVTAIWTRAVDQIGGLWHLEGENLSVLGDGNVAGSPNNPDNDLVTVTNGVATLDSPYGVIQAGLPYISDIETLDIDIQGRRTIKDRKKLARKVLLTVRSSMGVFAGRTPPSDDETDPLEGLREYKARTIDDGYDDPVALKTGVIDVRLKGTYNDNGRVFVRQIDPLPMNILAVGTDAKISPPR